MGFKHFLKDNIGWILTGIGTVGSIGTNILVAKETPKVREELEEAGPDASLGEKLKIGIRGYWPALLTEAGTLGCMWGAQAINAGRQAELIKGQAMLLATCGAMATQQQQYREEVRTEVGDKREKELFAEANRKTAELQKQVAYLKKEAGVQLWTMPILPGLVFEESYGDVCNALMHFNRNLTLRGSASVAELYSFLGIPDKVWTTNDSSCSNFGWETYENEVSWGCLYTDFPICEAQLADGRKVNIIHMDIPPYELGLDYGNGACSCDYLYGNTITDPDLFDDYLLTLRNIDIVRAEPPEIMYYSF